MTCFTDFTASQWSLSSVWESNCRILSFVNCLLQQILYQESVQITCIELQEFSQVEHTVHLGPAQEAQPVIHQKFTSSNKWTPLCQVLMVLGTNCICYKDPKWLSWVDENFVPMTYTILSGKKLKVFSPKSET